MKKEELEKLKLNELKALAKEKDLKTNGLKKDQIISLLEEKEEIPVKEETETDASLQTKEEGSFRSV